MDIGESRFSDGRIYILAALICYFGAICLSSLFMPFDEFWQYLHVQALPTFEDMRCVLHDGEAVMNGRPTAFDFFYPPAMNWFAYLGLRESHTFVAGLALDTAFFIVLLLQLGRIRRWHAPFYGVIICSPPIMLGVSRANVDLLVFILFCGALALATKPGTARRAGAYGLIYYAALLKLNPIFASILALKERPRIRILVWAVLAAAFGAYLWLIREDLLKMIANFPKVTHLAFGAPVAFHLVFGPAAASWAENLSRGVSAVAVLLAWIAARADCGIAESAAGETGDQPRLDAFRVGAAMYIGCFALVQYNFYYRLVFLLLTLPQWLAWRQSKRLARLPTVALATMVIGFWLPRYVHHFFYLDQLADWIVFYACARALLATLPENLRCMLRISRRTIPA